MIRGKGPRRDGGAYERGAGVYRARIAEMARSSLRARSRTAPSLPGGPKTCSERGSDVPSNLPNGIATPVASTAFQSLQNVIAVRSNAARPCFGGSSVQVGETMRRPPAHTRAVHLRRCSSASSARAASRYRVK